MRFTSEDVRQPLTDNWSVARIGGRPGAPTTEDRTPEDPTGIQPADTDWRVARVPGTVADTLRDAGVWAIGQPNEFGTSDHWYRCEFSHEPVGGRVHLLLGGLATIADVWLNGEHLLRSDNMFLEHLLDVTGKLRARNTLLIRFQALEPYLRSLRGSVAWRTALVRQRGLRSCRTTILPHASSWCPDVVPVGPWRSVELVVSPRGHVLDLEVRVRVDAGHGIVDAKLLLRGFAAPNSATLRVGDREGALSVSMEGSDLRVSGTLDIESVVLWWPHTHGEQPLYDASVELEVDSTRVRIPIGRLGFRTIGTTSVDQPGLTINGVDVDCRGACWTPLDLARLVVEVDDYREALLLARECGMNMLRVGGTMVYESASFYELCDELGILVWQDFMFASMDYPSDDKEFVESVEREARSFLLRTQHHCSLAVLCGGSEVEQQAVMFGLEPESVSIPLFSSVLRRIARELRPDVPYWNSSPTGGALPFHVRSGIAHYFGVGAYQRPITDARYHGPLFASECLAFSNVPEPASLAALGGPGFLGAHDPLYKQRVPRDATTGWDFADTTDFYVELLFGRDTRKIRYAESDRYFELCRVGIGELMRTVAGYWRRSDSPTRGALVWTFRDLWLGAGWGLIDSTGTPKSVYYYLKRAWSERAVWLVDDGLDGLQVYVANDSPAVLNASLTIALLGTNGETRVTASTEVDLAPRSQWSRSVDDMIGRFTDTSYAYRFGPRLHEVVAAWLVDRTTGAAVADDFHFPGPLPSQRRAGVAVEARVTMVSPKEYDVELVSEQFCQAVALSFPGFRPSDNYLHLAPGRTKSVRLCAVDAGRPCRGSVRPLNATTGFRARIDRPDPSAS